MILDSSAVVAILLKEPPCDTLLDHLNRSASRRIGTPTLAETGIVLSARLGILGKTLLARFVAEADLKAAPFSDRHWQVAIGAYQRFGKRRHPANLNFGDCLTYATARLASEPLLCVGDDFAQTDLPLVQ